jgi:hypothetical protein
MAPDADHLTVKVARKRKCKVCPETFTPARPMQRVCSPKCALEDARLKREKAERKALAEAKEAALPMKKRFKRAQDAVNRYVRARDFFLGCCSCEKGAYWDGQWHASHFKSVGSNSRLRFHLWNIHKGCSECNRNLSGNIINYRPRLIHKIGADRVEWLDYQNGITKFTPEYLDRLARVFNKKAARQEKRNQAAQKGKPSLL